MVQPLVCSFSPFKHIYPLDDNFLLQFPFPGCCEHENQRDLARGYGDDISQVSSCFNPMSEHSTFCLWDTWGSAAFGSSCSHSLCYCTDPGSCSGLLSNSLCSLLHHLLLQPKPPPELQWGKGNSTELSCHPPCPQNILCKPRVKNWLKAYNPWLKAYNPCSHQIVLSTSSTAALPGDTVFPQYLRPLPVVFSSGTSRGVMGHELFRKYKFPLWCHLWQGHSGGKLHVGEKNPKEIRRMNN